MKERPMLFNGPMVRAILEGRKIQTRRVINPQDAVYEDGKYLMWAGHGYGPSEARNNCPFGQPGDRLWVKETWCDTNYEGSPAISYQATRDRINLMDRDDFLLSDGSFNYDDPRLRFGKKKKPLRFAIWCHDLEAGIEKGWKPSIHMPRWASRLTLGITDVRVERLQCISEQDAVAEGNLWGTYLDTPPPSAQFRNTWEYLYGREAWESNPRVWVIEFKKLDPAKILVSDILCGRAAETTV